MFAICFTSSQHTGVLIVHYMVSNLFISYWDSLTNVCYLFYFQSAHRSTECPLYGVQFVYYLLEKPD